MVSADTLKEYGYGDDGNWQSNMADICIGAAVKYMSRAGVQPRTNDAEYDLAILMLASHWYDNRGVQAVGTITPEIAKGVQSIIHQLANSE